ncbi:phage tail tape measure protein [Nostoc sp. NIES-2111]
MTREVEARLKIAARAVVDRTVDALAAKLEAVSRKAEAFNRRQGVMARQAQEMFGVISRYAGPAVLGYAAAGAFKDFAALERQMTRIGMTAGSSAEDTQRAWGGVQQVAKDLNYDSVQPAIEALDTLVASGQTLEEAMAFLPSVLATAQASGAATSDIANTGLKAASALKIEAKELQRAFDIMVTGGKAGQFELKDMAREIPGLANSFATLGYEGEEGLKRLVAILQTIREDTGDASSAATQAQNIFGKMLSGDTIKKFSDFGIDLRKEMEAARKTGEDAVSAFVRLSKEAVDGDYTKLPLLFTDQEFRLGMTSLMTSADSLEKFLKVMNSAEVDGTVFRDLNRVMSDTQASIDRMSNSWERLKNSFGSAVAPVASEGMDALSSSLDYHGSVNAGLEKSGVKGFWERTKFGLTSSADEKMRMAIIGGYKDREDLADYYLRQYESGTVKASVGRHGSGVSAPGDHPPSREERRAMLRNADPAAIGMAGMGGTLIEEASRAGDEIKTRSEEAGNNLAKGGEQAASAMERAAQAILSAATALSRLGTFSSGGGGAVNANTGRSMSPASGRPPGTGRQ